MFYLIALIIIVAAGLMLVLISKRQSANDGSAEEKGPTDIPSDCCGAHEVCDFEEYRYNEEVIEYFDDEELDALRNVREDELTPENIDNLREVLYTMQTNDINRWLISLGRRHIHLPEVLQQEARQLMAENH